jgi:hypothetical protein
MSICSLNFIPILITVIFCGFLFVYFNARLGEMKNTLEKQNRVLTSFITSVQNDIRGDNSMGMCAMGVCPKTGGSSGSSDHLASEEAVRAVQKLEREKIVVSDDEDEDEDDDSDSESDSESESESESEGECEENIKVIKLNKHSENMPSLEFELLSEVHVVESVGSVDAVEAVDAHAHVVDAVEVVEASAVDEPLNLLNLIPMDDESLHADVNSISAYEHMKVDDLRKIVSDKSLASKEEVKKLKKPELIALLKK